MGLREPEGQGDGGGHDDGLPAPEVELREGRGEHGRLQQPGQRVVDAGEDEVAGEGKHHGIGVQWTQAPEGGVGQVQVGRPPRELKREDDADQHAHGTPDDRGDEELFDDGFVDIGRAVHRGWDVGIGRGGHRRETSAQLESTIRATRSGPPLEGALERLGREGRPDAVGNAPHWWGGVHTGAAGERPGWWSGRWKAAADAADCPAPGCLSGRLPKGARWHGACSTAGRRPP